MNLTILLMCYLLFNFYIFKHALMQPLLRFFRRKSSKDLQPTPADLDYEIITFTISGKDEPTFDITPSENSHYDYSRIPKLKNL